jgi:hypothetical protein
MWLLFMSEAVESASARALLMNRKPLNMDIFIIFVFSGQLNRDLNVEEKEDLGSYL